ncbi:protein argonaute 4-like, partial [Trifolium medium]|nr:protein argonaute 4-like [Trifolium medium]
MLYVALNGSQCFLQSLRNSRYGDEPMLCSSGITIEPFFIEVEGRVLQAPT